MGLLGDIFGGGGSSSSSTATTTTKTTSVKTITDESIAELEASSGGVVLQKRGRGRQVVNIEGISGPAFADVIKSLSGSQVAAFGAIAARGQAVEDIARSATGEQTEVGKIIGQVAPWLIALLGLFLFFGRRK